MIVLLYFVVNEARELAAARREAGSFAAGLGVYFSSLEVCYSYLLLLSSSRACFPTLGRHTLAHAVDGRA